MLRTYFYFTTKRCIPVIVLTLAICQILSSNVYAAVSKIYWGKLSEAPSLQTFAINNADVKLPSNFSVSLKGHNKATYSLRANAIHKNPNGMLSIRYNEYYKGVPVFGKQIILHQYPKNSILFATGNTLIEISKDIKSIEPKISSVTAIHKAMQYYALHAVSDIKQIHYKLINHQLIVYPQKENNHTKAKLAYKVSFFATGKASQLQHPIYIIDAQTGKLITTWDSLEHKDAGQGSGGWDAASMGKTPIVGFPPLRFNFGNYAGGGDNFGKLYISINGNKCTFENSDFYLNSTLKQQSDAPITEAQASQYPPFSYTCSTPDYVNTNDAGQAPIRGAYSPNNNAYYFTDATYTMYRDVYGLAQPYGSGGVRVYTYMQNVDNAFAITAGGSGQQAYKSQFWVGNGASQFMPLASADIISHELGHILTGVNSNLIYANQSGGMNEAFSDIVGEALKYYLKSKFPWFNYSDTPGGATANENLWVTGYEVALPPSNNLRDLYNQARDGSSVVLASDYNEAYPVYLATNTPDEQIKQQIANGKLVYVVRLNMGGYQIGYRKNNTYQQSRVPSDSQLIPLLNAIPSSNFNGSQYKDITMPNSVIAIKKQLNTLIIANKGTTPTLDPHMTSGIYNRAAYIMATESPGLTPTDVFKYFIDANIDYWTPDSSFDLGACGVEQEAFNADFPPSTNKNCSDSIKCTAVTKAFAEVGIKCRIGVYHA